LAAELTLGTNLGRALPAETLAIGWQITGIIAEVVLAAAAVVGLAALFLTKKDMITRSKRDAIQAAISQCEHFASVIIPEYGNVMEAISAAGLTLFEPGIEGPLPFDLSNKKLVGSALAWYKPIDVALQNKCFMLLNHLEAYAMYFTTRLADVSVAYGPTSVLPHCQSNVPFRYRAKADAKPSTLPKCC